MKGSGASEPVDLNSAIQEVIVLARNEIHGGGVKLRLELAVDLPALLGDRVQLQQVVLNLITNAVQAMSGINSRPRELILRTQTEDRAQVLVTFEDTGVGMDRTEKDRIFEAFYTTKSGGMGMGLWISRAIIENHGGRLWASTNDGPGATFQFTLPLNRNGHLGRQFKMS